MIAAVRLRRGKAADARGAGPFTGEALAAARQAGATGTVVVRADSQFCNADVAAACRRANRQQLAVGWLRTPGQVLLWVALAAWVLALVGLVSTRLRNPANLLGLRTADDAA